MFSIIRRKNRGEVDRFRNEMDRLFDRFYGWGASPWIAEGTQWMPSVDVSETKKKVLVEAELPGMDPKDIDISIDGNRLTFRGERKHEHSEKGESFHRVERSYGAFCRTIELPADVDSNKVKATYKKGVLKVDVTKAKEGSTSKIKVKSA